MDASDNKSSGAVDIMTAVLSNMNKELPMVNNSGGVPVMGKDVKRGPPLNDLNDADLDDLERSDNGDGSEKKDESTEKKATNTSNETGASTSSCRDDSDVDIYVSATSNKLIGYRYSVEELLEISAVECCKARPEFFANEMFKVTTFANVPCFCYSTTNFLTPMAYSCLLFFSCR